jgi:membrane-bound metal-dependent hydrolase YbcI (DUF457 family)
VDFFTHLFLETALIWVLLGAFHAQDEFLSSKARKASFWLVMLGATVPDIDLVVMPAAHRLFTHSLVFPLIAILVGVALWATHRRRITYTISWAIAFGLLAHLLLDFEGIAPMGLFWPFSPLVFAPRFVLLDGGGGMPHVLFVIFVYTAQEWLAMGGFAMETGVFSFQIGIPILAFLLFIASVGRDFWPWWPCCRQQRRAEPVKQG